MAYVFWFLILFSLFGNISSTPCKALPGSNDTNPLVCRIPFGKGIKHTQNVNVSRKQPLTYEFFTAPENTIKDWDLLQVTLEVVSASASTVRDYPVAFSIQAKGSALSFSIPFNINGATFNRAELYLCPNSNLNSDSKSDDPRPQKAAKKKKGKKGKKDREKSVSKRAATDAGKDDDKSDIAMASIISSSDKEINVQLSATSIPMSNFMVKVDNDKPTNLASKASEPWVHKVEIPENVNAVRITAVSKENLCSIMAVQEVTCPFVTSEINVKRAQRRLTFLKQGSMVVRRSELDSFYIVMLTLPNDKKCGNLKVAHGRQDEKKSINLTISSIGQSYNILPIALTVVFYSLFFAAIAPIKLVKSFLKGPNNAENPPAISVRSDDDGLMDASVSRPMSPRPTQQDERRVDVETGHLITIGSTNSSVVDSEIVVFAQLIHSLNNQDDSAEGTSGVQNAAHIPAPMPEILEESNVDVQQDNGELRQRISTAQSAPSEISSVLLQSHSPAQGAAKLNLDSPTKAYAWIHTILCGFLLLVVIQQISWIYPQFIDNGDMDICYFNSRCATPLGPMNAFNHTFSNIGYVALGILELLILKRRYVKHKANLISQGPARVHSFGLPTHFGMMTALAIGMVFQGLLSAVYHQCPNSSSIQFESINVYLTAFLALLKLYGSRHEPTEPHIAYGVALVFWTLATISSVFDHPGLWWICFCAAEMILMPILTLQIYYHGHVAYSTDSITTAYRSLKTVLWSDLKQRNWRPLFKHRLTALIGVNVLNILTSVIVAASGTVTLPEYIISGMIVNFILYFGYYLCNKISEKESIRKLTWVYLSAALVFWIPALKYFFSGTTDWKLTAAESRVLNQECSLFGFYDSHDVWHLLSSVAMFFSFMGLVTLDDDLKVKKRQEIAIF